MTFLAGLAAQVLEWLLSKFWALLAKDIQDAETRAQQAKQAAAEAAVLQKAKTEKEVDDAAKSSLDNI
jgi:hypothetical protein